VAQPARPSVGRARAGAAGARRALVVLAALLPLALLLVPRGEARAANDPYQQYWTIETPHFRVHYARNLEAVAERVADTLEDVHGRLTPSLGHVPRDVTHVMLSDSSESANGSATALPYNTVRLFVTAPDDVSPLADYDDWILELTTHEYTHILHTDNISGLPAVVNAVLGKTMAPNQVQPRWILEGLAVLEESSHTSGGRNRSSIFDMYLRANVLAGRIAGLDQISHTPRSWPSGNYWYLYGSRFLTWIVDTYGEHTMRSIAADYGGQLVPFGINRSIRRATGRTYEQLYDGWKAHLGRLYGEQIDAAARAPGGLREGARLTHHGRVTQRPRWIPAAARLDPDVPEVLYYTEDGHHRSGFYRLPVPSAAEARESERKLWIRAQGDGTASFDRRGNVVFSTTEIHRRIYPFSDLSRLPAGVGSPDGDEPARARLTDGLRALDPDLSQDGRRVVFVINRRGTQYLSIADVLPEGGLGPPSNLVDSARFQQAYTPRFSPDGRRVAYSSWSRGGYRDVRVVDVATGEFFELAHDRAMDMQPSWSPDGKTIYFSSDRTGIPNIFAYDLAAQRLWQVTNVRTGALMPEVSPDGSTLLYVGYSSDGFDLHAMPNDRSSWAPAAPYEVKRPDPPSPPPHHDWPRGPYNALPTLRPYAYQLQYGPGTFGKTLTISTSGADVAGLHYFALNLAVNSAQAEPQASLAYTYGRLPFDYTATLFRYLSPQKQFRINDTEPTYPEDYLGVSNALSYSYPRAFDSFGFLASHSLSTYSARAPIGRDLNPQSLVTIDPPLQGLLSIVRLGFSYSNQERYLYSVGPSRGFILQVNADVATRETASDYDYYAFSYLMTRYLQMPWHPDHTLAMHARGAWASGNPSVRGAYYVGGFVDLPLLDSSYNVNPFQGGFVLRGYPPGSYAGSQFHLANLEYRMPLWHPERGLSTLPVFFNRVSALAFVDYGGAFNELDIKDWRNQFHTGYGGELLIDTTLGYFLATSARLGYARGGSNEAYPGGKLYMILSAPY
jgi:hypothetical protein